VWPTLTELEMWSVTWSICNSAEPLASSTTALCCIALPDVCFCSLMMTNWMALTLCLLGLDGCAMKRFEVSPDGRYLAFLGRYGSIHLLTAQVCIPHVYLLHFYVSMYD